MVEEVVMVEVVVVSAAAVRRVRVLLYVAAGASGR